MPMGPRPERVSLTGRFSVVSAVLPTAEFAAVMAALFRMGLAPVPAARAVRVDRLRSRNGLRMLERGSDMIASRGRRLARDAEAHHGETATIFIEFVFCDIRVGQGAQGQRHMPGALRERDQFGL